MTATIDLDDLTELQELDREGMLGHVAALPRQCRDAWAATRKLQLPARHFRAERILIAGMGGSAIGGDLAAAVAVGKSPIPILVHREYDLPAHVDRQTLVIASSYSGNTEETVSAFRAAFERGCPLVAITTGGELARLAGEWNVPLVSFDYRSQPRAALGYLFVSLLGILRAMGVVGRLDAELDEALAILEAQGAELAPGVPQAQNQAKQLAAELAGRMPIVVGSGPLAPVARRWKTQFNENGKNWACFEPLPEMNHNAVSGIHFPAEMAGRVRVLLLSSSGLHPRNRLRLELTRQVLEGQGIACHQVAVHGKDKLAQILSAVQLGDTVSCYLAFLNGTDPTAIDDIAGLKQRMSDG
jgi:glucose/mannose-6-phosphate isomerase